MQLAPSLDATRVKQELATPHSYTLCFLFTNIQLAQPSRGVKSMCSFPIKAHQNFILSLVSSEYQACSFYQA